ncbi:MAG: helix-turn-helix domain-containing protein, partial [Nitrospinaceae bacterium]
YYRLNVIPVKLPPLRERKEDIGVLADHFVEKHGRENNKHVASAAEETIALLKKYYWPGNVRELENIVERAILMCQGDTLVPSNLFFDEDAETGESPSSKSYPRLQGTIYEMEKELILQTLEEFDGNKTKAAGSLGISIRTLRNKLADYKNQ